MLVWGFLQFRDCISFSHIVISKSRRDVQVKTLQTSLVVIYKYHRLRFDKLVEKCNRLGAYNGPNVPIIELIVCGHLQCYLVWSSSF